MTSSLIRSSPLAQSLLALQPTWGEMARMRVPLAFAGEPAAKDCGLALSDLSGLRRYGLKGPAAAGWLSAKGVPLPPAPNRWLPLPGGGLIARLGGSEFLIEDGFEDGVVVELAAALGRGQAGVSPVLRQDAALLVAGNEARSLLAQTCAVDFAAFGFDERVVVMTSMTGVAVTVVKSLRGDVPHYRIWCDGSFGPYLWNTLLEIARELGGAAIGLASLFSEVGRLAALSRP